MMEGIATSVKTEMRGERGAESVASNVGGAKGEIASQEMAFGELAFRPKAT